MASYSRQARFGCIAGPLDQIPPRPPSMRTLKQIAARLEAGEPSRALIDQCLDRIKDPSGDGGRTFLKVYSEAACTTAEAYDALRRKGATPSPYAGGVLD